MEGRVRRGEIILLLGAALWTKWAYDTEWPRTLGATFIDPGRRWVPVTFFGWAICAALWWLAVRQPTEALRPLSVADGDPKRPFRGTRHN